MGVKKTPRVALPADVRRATLAVSEGLPRTHRVAVGLDDLEDLKADLLRGLDTLQT